MQQANILITGGAGFIGSHLVRYLARQGSYQLTVLDNLSAGNTPVAPYAHLCVGDVGDAALLRKLFGTQRLDAVLHLAASSQVGESMQKPAWYETNNVTHTQVLLQEMALASIPTLVFASSSAVYGSSGLAPVDENHPPAPISPYGHTKLRAEQAIAASTAGGALRYVNLRLFNAAGGEPQGTLPGAYQTRSHLIPSLLQVASGQHSHFVINGTDHPTPDGTCVRDYVHVWDVCAAFHLVLVHLLQGGAGGTFNVGQGQGYSVAQVRHAVQQFLDKPLPVHHAPRRAGDPGSVVADAGLLHRQFHWSPRYVGLEPLISDAWAWHCRA